VRAGSELWDANSERSSIPALNDDLWRIAHRARSAPLPLPARRTARRPQTISVAISVWIDIATDGVLAQAAAAKRDD
jgi:hypothetical protein